MDLWELYNPGQKTRHNGSLREDGTPKGPGFLGTLERPDGDVSTELSIGVNIDGQEVLIPALVPTLTQEEVNYLLSGGEMTDAIVGKAGDHAKERMKMGLSPFMEENDTIKWE